ncbi:hypothetical protein VMCG_01259 [Cytospora schulzeri]|uniref:Heterokaryon incompatibility domain-containing protein n=1 Tax=Cytospora schulzeri TaxID=448051 RepID=A0A423X543_9PEZI|nr:hypothetical protein VMCG_01259 [Valsa malicola]
MSTTRIEDEVPGFVYEPLPDAGKYIRLIAILDFDETRPIPVHCKLTTWPISEAPKYHAISYVWGDASQTATILLNDKPLQVTQNCEFTLRQATWYGGDFRRRYYWVDAICINQSSDEEKGPQVSLMGQVYTNAERVLACVGKCNRTSRGMAIGPVFIAKPRAEGRFDIVGMAFIGGDTGFMRSLTTFQVQLDEEDSIVGFYTYRAARASGSYLRGPPDDKMNEFLETRFCGQPGSSYAVMWEPGGRNDS